MNKTLDIFGLAFSDYLKGQTHENIIVDVNIGELEQLPVSYFFRDYPQMPQWEQMVLDACCGKVLDVGAGAGSHALYLQQKGLEVHSIDISPGAVACMHARGVRHAAVQDYFGMSEGNYDTILFLMNGAGMAQKLDNLGGLLENAAKLLTPGGAIFLESTDLLYMYEDEDGSAMIDLAGDYYGEIEYRLQYKDVVGESFPWLFVDYENLSHIASLSDLDCELFFSGETDNYIARLTKK
jgi:SAM-dependent methyltransferase